MSKRLPFKHNPEKAHFERWHKGRNPADIPHPYRMLITGLPNSGKTSLALSVMAQANPVWDELVLCHAKYFDPALDPSADNKDIEIPGEEVDVPEYADVDWTCALRTIPLGYTYFRKFQNKENSKKVLLVIDDVELNEWSAGKRERKSSLNKLFSYQSTHYLISIMILCQDPTSQLPVGVRRNCNVFVIHRGRDRNAISYFAGNVGFPKSTLIKLFDLCSSNHDSICFDGTDETPYPLRFNVINPIQLIAESKEAKEMLPKSFTGEDEPKKEEEEE